LRKIYDGPAALDLRPADLPFRPGEECLVEVEEERLSRPGGIEAEQAANRRGSARNRDFIGSLFRRRRRAKCPDQEQR
jgi:hypothetical protein